MKSLLVVAAIAAFAAQADPLSAVLERAGEYVARYEEKELGNLLVAETYLQTAVIYNYQGRGVTHTDRRSMQSDFLMLDLGKERIGLRLVNAVEGVAVRKTQSSFEAILSDPTVGTAKQIAAIQEESSRYNIGAVHRQINVPTSALKVVRKAEASRFSFTKRAEKKINGIGTWEINFKEERAPTLTHGLKGESLTSTGLIWIEPETGRILKTEFHVENPYSTPPAKAVVTVTYKEDKSLGMLVPDDMHEEYTTELTTVTAIANYSKYRLFKVDVKSSIESPSPNPQ